MPKSERQRLHLIKVAELKIGKPMSEETKRRIGLGNKGKVHTKEHIEKFIKATKGKKRKPHSEQWKANLSKAKKGKPNLNARGEKHWNWKGGLRDQNNIIRHSLEYKLWRETVIKRDNYTCVNCGLKQGWNKNLKKSIKVHADHIKSFALYPELRLEVNNGRTLCRECHQKTHSWGINSKYIKKDAH